MTNTTISFAMREGAKLRPQGFNTFFPRRDGYHSCAIGAVCEYRGAIPNEIFTLRDVADYLQIDNLPIANPITDETKIPLTLYGVITLMNDELNWTRERIADYVETFENNTKFIMSEDETAHIKSHFANWGYKRSHTP